MSKEENSSTKGNWNKKNSNAKTDKKPSESKTEVPKNKQGHKESIPNSNPKTTNEKSADNDP